MDHVGVGANRCWTAVNFTEITTMHKIEKCLYNHYNAMNQVSLYFLFLFQHLHKLAVHSKRNLYNSCCKCAKQEKAHQYLVLTTKVVRYIGKSCDLCIKVLNSQYGNELGSGQKASQVSSSSLAEDSRLGHVLQELPQVIQESLCEGLRQAAQKKHRAHIKKRKRCILK